MDKQRSHHLVLVAAAAAHDVANLIMNALLLCEDALLHRSLGCDRNRLQYGSSLFRARTGAQATFQVRVRVRFHYAKKPGRRQSLSAAAAALERRAYPAAAACTRPRPCVDEWKLAAAEAPARDMLTEQVLRLLAAKVVEGAAAPALPRHLMLAAQNAAPIAQRNVTRVLFYDFSASPKICCCELSVRGLRVFWCGLHSNMRIFPHPQTNNPTLAQSTCSVA